MATAPRPPNKVEPSLQGVAQQPTSASAVAPKSKRGLWIMLGFGVLLISLLGTTWWLNTQPEERPKVFEKGLPPPGFVDLGLLRRDLSNGDVVQVQIVIGTPTKDDAEKIQHYLPELRRVAVEVVGKENSADLIDFEGKRALRGKLLAAFQAVVDPDRADLLQGIVYTQFLISGR